MSCVCRGQSLVMETHGHEGPTRNARELGRHAMDGALRARTPAIEPRVNHLQPTVFVDAIPELASERSRLQATVMASSRFTLRSYRNDAA